MDPYLEQPALWPDVHNRLIVALADDLAPRLRPRYVIAVEERTYSYEGSALSFAGRPDLTVTRLNEPAVRYQATPRPRGAGVAAVELPVPDLARETYLEIRGRDERVVTVLEILSPANKVPGEGRELYERKRRRVLGSLTNLVEIDLLRGGQPMAMSGDGQPAHYRILVSRGHARPWADLTYFGVRDPIPDFPLPLQAGEEEPRVALNALLHALYDRAGYDLRIDYRGEPEPPLDAEDAAWAAALLHEARLRS
jgi:hypothetical protein